MGKKSRQASMKISKHEKKQPLNSLIKILKPKVYITDSTNVMSLVQELTGNRNLQQAPSSPPPPPVSVSPTRSETTPHLVIVHEQDQNSPDFYSSSCFSTPLDGSPDLRVPDESLNHVSSNSWDSYNQNMYGDLESFLMKIDSIPYSTTTTYDDVSWSGMMMQLQQEVCAYDHYDDLSEFFS